VKALSGRERLLRVFRQQLTDRMPFWLWGVDPMFRSDRSPSWEPLYELVETYELDIMRWWYPKKNLGRFHSPALHLQALMKPEFFNSLVEETRKESNKGDMWEYETIIKIPGCDLSQVYYQPKDGSPGYEKTYFIKDVEDAKKWLSIPHRVAKPTVEVDSYFELQRKTGDRTMIMVMIPEAMYSVQALTGPETFSFWLKEERSLLHEMIDCSYKKIENLTKYLLSHNVGDCYGWVGPEVCIPPLASPEYFREFVFDYDKRIIDLIHNAGKLVWVHCHGDMEPVLLDFVKMEVDCLNPIEPPPVGSLTLAEAKKIINGGMTLDGGIPNNSFDVLEPEKMEKLVEETVAMGKPGGCYILGETSDPSTWPTLTEKHIANYKAFVETGIRLANYD
jgi:hypothetical protein